MIQPAVGSPTTLPSFRCAIAFGEILGVGERVLIDHQDRRQFERSLAELSARGSGRAAAVGHGEIGTAGQHVQRVSIDKAAVVVADVDDHALLGAVFGVEVDIELRERLLRHIAHVNVAEPAVADSRDVGAIVFHPFAINLFGERAHRPHDNIAAADVQHHALVHFVLQQFVEVHVRPQRRRHPRRAALRRP